MRLSRSVSLSTCRCGHDTSAHQHYRRGTDCALCECQRFRATVSLSRGRAPRDGVEGGGEVRLAQA